ncbi:MAG: DNA-directed RNA polymerase subunit alpha [Treponema sp.]|jgi:DNA-directed RNA polymerase subunit alpha|nr:DNA-directed RNA polymerase subunit alpha [Treponema sp.]
MSRKNLLKGFKRPKDITFEHSDLKQNYFKFSVSPFERGFGTTVGNTLRRVLLSSIQGYAITAIKVTSYNEEGVAHMVSSEFETIPNIVEDTLEVISNLKQIRLKLLEDAEQETFTYEWSGKMEIKSNDFSRPGKLEILSQNQHIMTLMENAKLEFRVQVDLGRGYIPAEDSDYLIEEVGTIPLDAIFSPVKKVKFSVEPTRVGQRSDYDKLVMEIWTDGTIHPNDALAEAAKIVKEHFSVFINFDEGGMRLEDEGEGLDEYAHEILNTSVEELDLSVRSSNCLKNANIRVIGELIRKTEDDIAKTRNFGKKSLQEIKEKLQEWNLSLGITDLKLLKNAVKVKPQKEVVNEA